MEGSKEERPRQPRHEEYSLISGEKKEKIGLLSGRGNELTRYHLNNETELL
jgi:hypothetical protein